MSKVEYNGNPESERAYFTVTRDSENSYICKHLSRSNKNVPLSPPIVVCFAPGASKTVEAGGKANKRGLYHPGTIWTNANWRWLAMVKHALMHNDQAESNPSSFDRNAMLEHLMLRILVGSHWRNTKLLEVLQGANILNRWHVHTYDINVLVEYLVRLTCVQGSPK